MLRRAISFLALTAALATSAAAQAPFTSPFWFEGEGPDPGGVLAPYGERQGSFTSAQGPWFQVFCVEYGVTIGHPVDAFNVWVTPFGSGDLSHLHTPAQAWAGYTEAAQFASLMVGGGGYTEAEQTDIQRAIWYAMGFAEPGGGTVWLDAYNAYSAQAHAVAIDPDEWIVITNTLDEATRQEHIAFRPNPPQEIIIPEPATMTLLATGLAGLAAARHRRKS